jgi:hypothetical protein
MQPISARLIGERIYDAMRERSLTFGAFAQT